MSEDPDPDRVPDSVERRQHDRAARVQDTLARVEEDLNSLEDAAQDDVTDSSASDM